MVHKFSSRERGEQVSCGLGADERVKLGVHPVKSRIKPWPHGAEASAVVAENL